MNYIFYWNISLCHRNWLSWSSEINLKVTWKKNITVFVRNQDVYNNFDANVGRIRFLEDTSNKRIIIGTIPNFGSSHFMGKCNAQRSRALKEEGEQQRYCSNQLPRDPKKGYFRSRFCTLWRKWLEKKVLDVNIFARTLNL